MLRRGQSIKALYASCSMVVLPGLQLDIADLGVYFCEHHQKSLFS